MVWLLSIRGKLHGKYIYSEDITQKIFRGVCHNRPGGEYHFKGDFRRSDISRLYIRLDDEVVEMARDGASFRDVVDRQREINRSGSSGDKKKESSQFELSDYV